MTSSNNNDIAAELNRIEQRLNELDDDPIMKLIHVNYMAMLEQAKHNVNLKDGLFAMKSSSNS